MEVNQQSEPLAARMRLERHAKRKSHPGRPAHLEIRDASLAAAQIRSNIEEADSKRLAARLIPLGPQPKPGGGSKGGGSSDDDDDSGSPGSSHDHNASHGSSDSGSPSHSSTGSDKGSSSDDEITKTTKAAAEPSTTSERKTSSSTTRSSTTVSKSTSSTTTSSTSSSTTSSTIDLATYPTTQPVATYVVTAQSTPTPTLAAASPSTSSSDDGPGAGPIIGIVAGALVGFVVISALAGFIIKKMRNKPDPYEANPFDRDAFHRHSTMLPDSFDDDDMGGAPSMSEHNLTGNGMQNYDTAALAAVGGAGMVGHNEGGPRPPTMFQKHINAPAAQSGGMYGGDMYADDGYGTPQLPPMAFGAADPYGHGLPPSNIANPYAHLDRGGSLRSNGYPAHDPYGNLDRSGSQGSGHSQGYEHHEGDYHDQYGGYPSDNFTTAGRPSTAEGRSGTPDLPNVQQTYAMNGTSAASEYEHANRQQSLGSNEMMHDAMSNPHPDEQAGNPFNRVASPTSPGNTLSVRNLLPSGHGQQETRPLSTVSSNADPDDAYGGVY